MLSPTEDSRVQGLFKVLSDFPVLFKANLILMTFKESPLKSSTFQASANPVVSQEKMLNLSFSPAR